jgi:hypothetical protein
MKRNILLSALVCWAWTAPGGMAAQIFSAHSGSRSAQLTAQVVGNQLVLTLTNTATVDAADPTQVLTAVFFDVGGNVSLTPTSAVLSVGSSIAFCCTGTTVVGGEWAFRQQATGFGPGGTRVGISAAGFGMFGNPGFPGANLSGPQAVGGLQFGIVSLQDNINHGNAAVTGQFPLIQGGVTFTFDLPHNTDVRLSKVVFQYGTDTCEPSLPGVATPEPGAWLLLGTGLTALLARRWRKR